MPQSGGEGGLGHSLKAAAIPVVAIVREGGLPLRFATHSASDPSATDETSIAEI